MISFELREIGGDVITRSRAHVVPRIHDSIEVAGKLFRVLGVLWQLHDQGQRQPVWSVVLTVEKAHRVRT